MFCVKEEPKMENRERKEMAELKAEAEGVKQEADGGKQDADGVKQDIDAVEPEPAIDDMVFLNDFEEDLDVEDLKCSMEELNVDGLLGESVFETDISSVIEANNSSETIPVSAPTSHAMCELEMDIPGFRPVADADLLKASVGEDKQRSANNDRWALRRVDALRAAMKWDLSVPFGDLPFDQIDLLLSNLFARVVNVKSGGTYPAASLMNMLGGYNRLIRRASDVRTLNGKNSCIVDRSFQIKNHPSFTRTRLTLKAALTKGQKEGANKKAVKKVHVISQAMEEALFADLEHQLTDNRGAQKQLALLLLLRIGLRGGDELWELDRDDITIEVDKAGKEYVKFEERTSKNNSVSLDRYQQEQFRKVFHSYEAQFIMCVKQYKRHLPVLAEGVKRDLFLGCITNPVGNVWYNRGAKVGKDTSQKWLKNMLGLVGIPGDLITNKSGRATLITRLAASGVPDEVGRLISGHHTLSGYSRYDRTQPLKMEAAQLCTFNPGMTYDTAITEVSRKFVSEELVGTSAKLKPLVDKSIGAEKLQVALRSELHACEVPDVEISLASNDGDKALVERMDTSSHVATVDDNKFSSWHRAYDGIDWEEAISKDPVLARVLGSQVGNLNNLGGNTFSNLSNCTIQICVGPMQDTSKDKVENKENLG